MKTSNSFCRVCFTLTILALLALGGVLLDGCQSPITNTVTIGANGIITTNGVVMPSQPTNILDWVCHALLDPNGVLATELKKSMDESRAKEASETSVIETIEIIIVISAAGIFIYARKIKKDLSEEINRVNEGAPGKSPVDEEISTYYAEQLSSLTKAIEALKNFTEILSVKIEKMEKSEGEAAPLKPESTENESKPKKEGKVHLAQVEVALESVKLTELRQARLRELAKQHPIKLKKSEKKDEP